MARSARKTSAGAAAAVAEKNASTPLPTPQNKKATKVNDTAPTKKASVSALKVKDGEALWTKGELDEVMQDLHTNRDRLVKMIEDQELELTGLMEDAGDGAGQDQADLGATSFERDHELTLMNSEREMLSQIDRALARIEDGTYGVCESCEKPIGKMRVMAFPRATLCLPCKQREERR